MVIARKECAQAVERGTQTNQQCSEQIEKANLVEGLVFTSLKSAFVYWTV